MNTRAVLASRITLKRSLLAAAVTIGVSWGVVAFIDRYQEITVVPERSFATTEYSLGDSELATPVTVDLASLASKLNSVFPEGFRHDWKDSARFEVSTGLPRIRCRGWRCRRNGRVKVKIDVPYQGDARLTRGAIELVGHGNDLEVRMPVSFWVRLSGRGSLGRQVHETAEGRFVLSARVNASLTEAWGADIQLTHTLEWQGAPGGKLFNAFPYTIRGLVEDGVNREAAKLVAQINMELNQGLKLKERALAVWNEGHIAWRMHPDQSLWGVVSPRSMLVAPLQFADGKASTLLKMTLATEVLYTATIPVAPTPTPLPPLTLGSGSEEGGMTMNVPLRVSYSTMSRSMLEFAQRSSDLQEAGIKVNRVEFYPAGDRLVARVHAAVDVSGRLFDSNVVLHVAGRPVVDPNTRELTVAAFEIDRTIDNRLVDILETPMHGLFERAVQAQLRTDMTALIASANGHISEELKSLETQGVDVLTQITEVTVGETQFLEEVFVVPLQIRGELGVDVDLAKVAAL